MKSAMGMLAAMVKTPQELSLKAFTTANPNPARATRMMKSTATAVVTPARGPSSCRAISATDLPPRRTEANRITTSCTAPANTTPINIHKNPGMNPN